MLSSDYSEWEMQRTELLSSSEILNSNVYRCRSCLCNILYDKKERSDNSL